jgi:hypothetical protein
MHECCFEAWLLIRIYFAIGNDNNYDIYKYIKKIVVNENRLLIIETI